MGVLIRRELIIEALDSVLTSTAFRGSDRSATLLRYIVQQTLDGQADGLKEYPIGSDVLGRGQSFDPRIDPIVRAEASRLRRRLEQYYGAEGRTDTIVIEVPKGSYVPLFRERAAVPTNAHLKKIGSRLAVPPGAWISWGIALAFAAAAAGFWFSARSLNVSDQPLVRLDVELSSNGTLSSDVGPDVILSPDGTQVVFVSRDAEGISHLNLLNLRRLDRSRLIELPGTEGARSPFFSPDGRWVGFFAAQSLKKTSLAGGSPFVICEATGGLGASWGEDDNIIANLNATGILSRVPSSGGAPVAIADLTNEHAKPTWPQVLPGAATVLFTRISSLDAHGVTLEALSLRDGKRSELVRGAAYGRYLPHGHIAYVNQGALFAVPFDLASMKTEGAATPLLDDVSYAPSFGYAQVDFSRTGVLVYRAATTELIASWVDESGNAGPVIAKPGRYWAPRLSPDGRRLAVARTGSGAATTEIHDLETRRTAGIAPRAAIWAWSPDGRLLVGGGGPSAMQWIPVRDPERLRQVLPSGGNPWSFTPDGKRLAYYKMGPTTGFDIWTIRVDMVGDRLTTGVPEPFLRSPAIEVYPSFSPDGRWLAYGSNKSGTTEVYVRAFPDNGTEVRVSDGGGRIPRWSPNGRELLYRTDDQRLMVVTYATKGGVLVAGKPRPWTTVRLADTGVLPNFDLALDGKRVLALLPASESHQTENHATFVLNFFDEVRRRTASIASYPQSRESVGVTHR